MKSSPLKMRLLNLVSVLALLLGTQGIIPVHAAGILYVKSVALGTGNCSNWDNACTLQTALTNSVSGNEIWVVAGVYKPTLSSTDRTATFQLKSGVAVYGGFDGTETAQDQRDYILNTTILSGDIDNNDSQTPIITDLNTVTGNDTNSNNVIVGSNTDNTALLDGFTITGASNSGMYNLNGNPTLVNIKFNGNENASHDGGGMYNINSSPQLANVTFSGNAAYDGGGMYNYHSNPTIENSSFNGNTAGNSGGGIYNDNGSAPSLTNVAFSSNIAGNSGGAMLNVWSSPTLTNVAFTGNSAKGGGAINNRYESNPTLVNVTFSNNTALEGGGMVNSSSSPILAGVTFNNNTAKGNYGGGMYNDNGGNPTLTDVLFSENSAYRGGGMYNHIGSNPTLTDVTFIGNHADKDGGGLFNSFSNLAIADSTFEQNYTVDGNGGGINATGGTVTITNSTFSGNHATNGGAIYHGASDPAGEMTITNSTIYNNAADNYGGGIINGDSLTIVNSTLSGNAAGLNGGGLDNAWRTATIINSTFSANSANGTGGGIQNEDKLLFSNTLVANSISGGDCSNTGTISKNINNLVEDGSCGASLNGDPILAPLGNYGGGTQTLALLQGSSAIDAGDDATCAAMPVNNTSQNGVTRPQGVHCDIGAFEYWPTTFFDVPITYWARSFIERLHNAGVTGGCSTSPLMYCPEASVTRAQMAVFLLRGEHGSAYTPPNATGTVFGDVPLGHWAGAWIEQLAAEGITGGCGNGNFCPDTPVTRDQMAVFLLRAEHGASYAPPTPTGVFTDVPTDHWAAAWIEQLATEGITGGCGSGIYCPATVVNRAQMAVFLVRAFNLP